VEAEQRRHAPCNIRDNSSSELPAWACTLACCRLSAMRRSATDLLRQADVFARLPESELRKISKLLRERRLDRHQVLFRQGEPADALYVVVDGRLRISATDASKREKVLAFIGPGEIVGEMALMSGDPRSATATATMPAQLLQLRKADFDALLANNIDLMRELARVVARRREATQRRLLAETGGQQGRPQGMVTVLFSPRGGAGTTTIATNLAVALAQRAPDRVVLVDLNVLFGHVPLLLDLSPRTSLAAISPVALRQMERESFEFYLTTHSESSLRVLTSVLRPEQGELVTADHVKTAVELLRRHFVYVVIDLGRGFSEVNLAAIEAAHNMLMVCTPDRTGIRGATEFQRIFRDVLHFSGDPLQYILNHPWPYAFQAPERVEHMLNVLFVGSIPYGADAVARAALEGHPIVTRSPNSPVSKALVGIATRIEAQAGEVREIASARSSAADPTYSESPRKISANAAP
jgi:CRP-like cAMP-binding protein